MSEHIWETIAEFASTQDIDIVFNCKICKCSIWISRPENEAFRYPTENEMKKNHIDIDCDVALVRKIQESLNYETP